MYIVIVGAGDIGTPLIEVATGNRNEVVVVERDEDRAERVAKGFDCLVINDDATSQEVLEDAGAGRADALISTTNEDATNVMVCLLAQELSVSRVVSVVHDPQHLGLFERTGVHTMQNPQRLIAEYLYRAVRRPAIKDYMQVGDEAEVFEIVVDEGAPVAGKTLIEANEAGLLGEEVLVVAVERDGRADPITPRGNTRIEAGDLLTVYSASGSTADVTDVFGHFEDHD
jgi:trk system potassium uptake protein TrkA